jgi:hypothetical protein
VTRFGTGTQIPDSQVTSNLDSGFAGIARIDDAQAALASFDGNTTILDYPLTQVASNKALSLYSYRGNGAFQQVSDARFAFFSAGESLDISALQSRVSTLMSDLTTALP